MRPDAIYLLSASLQRSLDIVFLELEELHITSVPPTDMPTTVSSTAAVESATIDEVVTGSQKPPAYIIMPGELIAAAADTSATAATIVDKFTPPTCRPTTHPSLSQNTSAIATSLL